MIFKLRNKIILYSVVLSLLAFFISGYFAKKYIKYNFDKYVEKNINERKKEILKSVEESFNNMNDGEGHDFEMIGMTALHNGFLISIYDDSGKELWNAQTYNEGLCNDVINKMSQNMSKLKPEIKGKYVLNAFPIKKENNTIATLFIGYHGPYFYSDSEILLFNTIDKILLIISFIYIIFSIITSFVIARYVSTPISKTIKVMEQITNGTYNKISKKSDVDELNKLIDSTNNLSMKLEKQEKIRKTMTKDISHELRTPITSIKAELEALIDGIWEPTNERLTSLYEEIERLSRLVKSLEELTYFENEKLILNKENVNFKKIINKIYTLFTKQLHDKSIECELSLENITVNADRDKLSQAIINIFSNSLKYTPHDGKIFIKTYKLKNKTYVSIEDTGLGISEEHLPFIFERFYRSDESRIRETGGSGIGLSISKAIIEAHNGSIKVESVINKGSKFTIII